MEARRLNLNTPLMSVRRNLSSASLSSTSLLKGRRTIENSKPKIRNVNGSMDMVTDPVSVPFTWEQVPGKAKDDDEHDPLPSDETVPATPVIAARNSTSVHDDCSATDEDDVYSDAVDTLSPPSSFSVGFSVSSLSGSNGPVMKRSGTFSVDTQTRDFMMGRFLPAARAMAMASESSLHYTSKNQHLLLTELPNEVEKPSVSAKESSTPSRQHNMEIVQYFTQGLPQSETTEEEEEEEEPANDDRSHYKSAPSKGCGLLPQLSLRSSLRLLNPAPGLKSRIKNSMPFVPAIRKDLKDESNSQSAEKFHLPVLRVQSGGPQGKSEFLVGTPKSEGGQIKPPGGSNWVNLSGELRKIGRLSPFRSRRNDVATLERSELPRPAHVVPPLAGLRRVNLSGELRPTTRKLSPFRSFRNDDAVIEKNASPRTAHVVPAPFRRSSLVNFSGELRSTSGLSPFRPPRNIDVVSLEKTESARPSNVVQQALASSRVNFSGELRTIGRLSPFRPSSKNDAAVLEKKEFPPPSYVVPTLGGMTRRNFSGELQTAGRLSPFRQESSQPSYVVPPVGWSSRRNFSGEMQTQRRQSPLRPPRNHSTTLQKESIMPSKQKPPSPAFERTLYVDSVTTGRNSCSDSNSVNCEAWTDPVAEEIATRGVEDTSTGKSSFQDIECLKVEVENGVLDPSLPLPSLKSPSQSWLWRTLPSVGARSRFPSPQKTAPLSSMKHDSNTCRADAKWETIVKTSKTYHDHTRYSEELIEHVSRQCKS